MKTLFWIDVFGTFVGLLVEIIFYLIAYDGVAFQAL